MRRVYFESRQLADDRLELDEAESRHLVKVRRAREGDPVLALDGCGAILDAVLEVACARKAQLRVLRRSVANPPMPELRLMLGFPEVKVFESVLSRCVELQVASIQPVLSAHCEPHADPGRLAPRQARWAQLLKDAVKQSGHPFLPALTPMVGFKAACASPLESGHLVLAAALQPDSRPFVQILRNSGPVRVCELWIGPEGDFSAAEYAELRERGAVFGSLGETVLKVETAVISTIAIVRELLAMHNGGH